MTVEQVLDSYLAGKGLSRSDTWIYVMIGGLRVPYVPAAPFRHFLTIHDLHHILSGYSTGLRDEICLMGWELTSGGWGRHNWWYLFKTIHLLWMFLLSPVRVWTALKDGAQHQNLYGFELDEVLQMEYDDAVAYVNGPASMAPPVAARANPCGQLDSRVANDADAG